MRPFPRKTKLPSSATGVEHGLQKLWQIFNCFFSRRGAHFSMELSWWLTPWARRQLTGFSLSCFLQREWRIGGRRRVEGPAADGGAYRRRREGRLRPGGQDQGRVRAFQEGELRVSYWIWALKLAEKGLYLVHKLRDSWRCWLIKITDLAFQLDRINLLRDAMPFS